MCDRGNNGGATGVTCTVFSESTSKGQKNWSMHATGRVRVFFLQANASAEAPILRYGRTYRGFGIRCTSRMSGLRCTNRSGHGFTLSRERQRTF